MLIGRRRLNHRAQQMEKTAVKKALERSIEKGASDFSQYPNGKNECFLK